MKSNHLFPFEAGSRAKTISFAALIKRVGLLLLLSTLNSELSTWAQGTAFTYQGRLNVGGNSANGSYDLTFALFGVSSGPGQIGGTLNSPATAVSNGVFSVTLDFGANFPGTDRWLEISVRTNGGGAFSTLSPRQKLTPAPYAITAENVAPGAGLSGVYGGAVTLNNPANQFTGSFTGNGANVTNVNAATLGGLGSANFWNTAGNAGTAPGANFVGTTDNQPLEIKVNGSRVLRLEPNANSPNLIGGYFANIVSNGSYASVIAGGGNSASPNRVGGIGATIGGGLANVATGNLVTVAGGNFNTAAVQYSTVAGGLQNSASNTDASVGGGQNNLASGMATTVAGGMGNKALVDYSTVGGGNGNSAAGLYSIVGGGFQNATDTNYSTVAGGYGNVATGFGAFIGGGVSNVTDGSDSVVGGGESNSTMGGYSTVGGGLNNSAYGFYSTVSGGGGGFAFGAYSTVGGGVGNSANASGATVGGGGFDGNKFAANEAGGSASTIGGGIANFSDGHAATVPGGAGCEAEGEFSFAAGNRAKANHDGAFVWADSIQTDFASSGSNQFLIRASGGVGIGINSPAAQLHVASASANPQLQITQNNGSDYTRLRMNVVGSPSWEMDVSPGATPAISWWTGSLRMNLDYNGNLTTTGTVNGSSDRNVKEHFSPVSARDVLEKVSALPITEWNYKNDNETLRHIGPMAQDFYAAFNVGTDDKHISMVDADGVALAAIQGLNQKLDEKDAKIHELEQRLETLEKQFQSRK